VACFLGAKYFRMGIFLKLVQEIALPLNDEISSGPEMLFFMGLIGLSKMAALLIHWLIDGYSDHFPSNLFVHSLTLMQTSRSVSSLTMIILYS